jgi:predicted nucleic acid-binding protein
MKLMVDANVFLRYFMVDEQKQAAQAEALFQAAKDGKVQLVCGPPVTFELAWTLRRAFGLSRRQVLETLKNLLALPGLQLIDAPLVRRAVELGEAHNMEFADAYIAASAMGSKAQLATFNERDFKDAGVGLPKWGRGA